MNSPEYAPGREPRLFFPQLEAFYAKVRELSWPLIRITIGGMLLVHGINKIMGPGVDGVAKGMATRGLEPAVAAASSVMFLETVGAGLIILGLFTRPVAAAIAIEFAVITFVAHWGNGFGWSNPRGGWEYPLLWGLMFLAVALRGGGPYSLDRRIGREV
jgi:putative oxidoreductase